MRTIGESAKLFDEGLIPWRFDHLDKAVFTLGHERISAVLFRALFPFSRDMVVIGFSGLFKDLRERCGISDPLIQLSRFPPRPHRIYPHDYSVPRKSHDCPTGCEPSWDYRGDLSKPAKMKARCRGAAN